MTKLLHAIPLALALLIPTAVSAHHQPFTDAELDAMVDDIIRHEQRQKSAGQLDLTELLLQGQRNAARQNERLTEFMMR